MSRSACDFSSLFFTFSPKPSDIVCFRHDPCPVITDCPDVRGMQFYNISFKHGNVRDSEELMAHRPSRTRHIIQVYPFMAADNRMALSFIAELSTESFTQAIECWIRSRAIAPSAMERCHYLLPQEKFCRHQFSDGASDKPSLLSLLFAHGFPAD